MRAEGHAEGGQPLLPEASFDVVAIGASAGGLAAIRHILSALPADFPAAIVIVQHLDPQRESLLVRILARRTALPVMEAKDGVFLTGGTVSIAPPDRHLLVNANGTLSLTHTELVHFVRPSVDLLFESVAASCRQRAIAVVLSGTGTDGAMGVQAIKETGGVVIVQDLATAQFGGMPSAAIHTESVDHVLPLEQIPGALIALAKKGSLE